MTEDQKNQEGTRSRSSRRQPPKIGGINQYATIGGAKRTSTDDRDAQTSERSNVESIEYVTEQGVNEVRDKRLDVQDIGLLDVREEEHFDDKDAIERERPRVQTTKVLDVEASSSSDIRDTSNLNAQTSESLSNQSDKHSNVQTSSGLVVQESKKEKEERVRQTVYLELDLDEWVRDHVNRERKRLKRRVEISEVVNNALRQMRNEINN